jgi:hypothetical protein
VEVLITVVVEVEEKVVVDVMVFVVDTVIVVCWM